MIPLNPVEFRKTIKDSENSAYFWTSNNGIMLDDYKKAVILDYHRKKEKGLLSSNLFNPTAAKLREECLVVLKTGTKRIDEKLIREFFNSGEESNDYSASIKRYDRDKFKPLDKFIKEGTEVRDEKNVEILAWLIGFEPRPYDYRIDYDNLSVQKDKQEIQLSSNDEISAPEPQASTIINETDLTPPEIPLNISKTKRGIRISSRKAIPTAAIFLALTIGTCLYAYWESAKVYICSSRTGDRYHLNKNCPMLKNCKNGKNDMIAITESEAKETGKTLCKFED